MVNKLFVYGILKRGEELDLAEYGATYLGDARIEGATLYGIGRRMYQESHPNDGREFHGVGLRLEDPGRVAYGEIWDIPDNLWTWLDQIEQNGFCYTRKVVAAFMDAFPAGAPYDCEAYKTVLVWVYEHTYPNYKYDNPIKGGKF